MDRECCAPVVETPLTVSESEIISSTFRVLADPVRLRLLSIIASVPEGEVCACDLTTPVGRSQATVSHHLSVLLDAGLVTREQRGKWAWFQVAPGRADFVRSVLEGSETKVAV
ncbi:MAG: metalloregulator ArsR/SmtB family transcription factor [Actinobacteria bacterium]|nr:metalloregulator ArsR/SmtB family transcription factor [Actinomycetota bacterium]MCI0544458.1 metalloregulator ArsR/SmtB family transcription factor [Actinomycetota bacterium]MCI0677699.1 metalloregulator ArsR/SmtB family transcription factor [Actinomycetota bacterium]